MKVGDLVLCPVDLETGEMYCGHKTLAMIDVVHEKEPRIGVIYLDTPVHVPMFGTWFTEEVELISEG